MSTVKRNILLTAIFLLLLYFAGSAQPNNSGAPAATITESELNAGGNGLKENQNKAAISS
jgi:hypothetical protein